MVAKNAPSFNLKRMIYFQVLTVNEPIVTFYNATAQVLVQIFQFREKF